MKTLTLWPEWAHAVAWLGKPIENRDWAPPWALIGERIAIHAGAHIGGRKGGVALLEGLKAVTYAAIDADLEVQYGHLPPRVVCGGESRLIVTGAVICTAVLARCEKNALHYAQPWHIPRETPPWANPTSKYWWHLKDVEVLPEPVPCKGSQGFWEWPS